jgi:phosphomannomutase
MKKLIVFDLDGTLAASKAEMDAEMAGLLGRLLNVVKVAVISGGGWPQFEAQVLARMANDPNLEELSMLPTSGTQFYQYDTAWTLLYAENFTEAEKQKILSSLQQVVDHSSYRPAETWGEIIEDRGSQITFSALGQQAPIEAKEQWDPDFSKRQRMKAVLDQMLPEFSVRLGGSTSIDVTGLGIDKAYGIRKLRDVLGIAIPDMIFIGDAIFPGGNDYPAKEAGVLCIQVRDAEETKRVAEAILACLTDKPPAEATEKNAQ